MKSLVSPTRCLALWLLAMVAAPLFAESPVNSAKPWTRWWWPGSAVSAEGITQELEAFAAAGLGGVEITPIYGVRGQEDREITFLSPRYGEMLEHTVREARRLGLGVDMATGTGWPFGGPWVTLEDGSRQFELRDGRLVGVATGMSVKRAAPGGEGRVVDPFNPAALARYLAPFDRLATLPEGGLRAQFHDSFEYYGANWTPALPARFRARYGYDLQDHAELMVAAEPVEADLAARVKHDYRELLAQLHLEYVEAWAAWARARGWASRNQAHGAPGHLLDLYAAADIPETEIFGSNAYPIPGFTRDPATVRHDQSTPEPLLNKMASSAAHVAGRRLVSSESCTWLRDHWREALSHAKPELDRVLLDGINHIFYHGTAYSPPDAAWPGWLFYAATQFNPRNPWWEHLGGLNRYLERVQTVLQAGEPDEDVLLYWPIHDIWSDPRGRQQQLTVHSTEFVLESAFGRLAAALRQRGLGFDYVSDSQLLGARATPAGELRTPGGTYRALVVPRAAHLPAETLRAMLALARAGGTVVFEALPADVPGWGDLEARRAAFRAELAALVFEETARAGLRRARVGAGEVWLGEPAAALRERGLRGEGIVAAGAEFVRRRMDDGHTYFVANLGAEAIDEWVELAVPAQAAVIGDPLSGETGRAGLEPGGDGGLARVRLQLAAGASLLLRTFEQIRPAAAAEAPWPYREVAGRPLVLDGPWSLEFVRGGPDLPAGFRLETLVDWTSLPDPEAQRFAGAGRYRIEFDAPERTAEVVDWRLELGEVRESARVWLNDRELGVLWSLPFEVRLGDALRPGRNVLEIEVVNLAANRIRDLDRRGVEWKIMKEINFVNINYRSFDASDWPLQPSGLLGPVRLVPLRELNR